VELRIDGTEVRVRRPRANRPGRRAFVSGKMRQNTKKATVISDEKARTLWTGAFRPGRQHDQTALKTEGVCDLLEQFPQVKAKVDAGYRGLAKQFPDQVEAPPLKPKEDAPLEEVADWEAARKKQSSERIPIEHANSEHKQWRAPATLDRTPRVLRRDPPGHRRSALRPHRHAVITHQPTGQADMPQPQSRTMS
jgi:hypothetical protein